MFSTPGFARGWATRARGNRERTDLREARGAEEGRESRGREGVAERKVDRADTGWGGAGIRRGHEEARAYPADGEIRALAAGGDIRALQPSADGDTAPGLGEARVDIVREGNARANDELEGRTNHGTGARYTDQPSADGPTHLGRGDDLRECSGAEDEVGRRVIRQPWSPVLMVAAMLIVAQIALRGWVAGRGYFYWDDLILVGRADRYPLWSPDLLLYDHDGHFMPLAFATAWVVTKIAPLQWAGPVVTMLLLQLAASISVLRMLLVLVPRRAGAVRWVVLIPLVGYLFSPLTLPAFAWWAASLNALPLQFALAWVIADAVLLTRTGRGRYAVSGVLVLLVGLLFFEKAVVVPFVAFAVAVLDRYIGARPHAVIDIAAAGDTAAVSDTVAAVPAEKIGSASITSPAENTGEPARPGVSTRAGSASSAFAATEPPGAKRNASSGVAQSVTERPGTSGWAAVRAVVRGGAALWLGSAVVLAGWAAAYPTVVDHIAVDTSLAGARRLLHSATSLGIVPTLLGGPWVWARWLPSTPWATPPGWAVVPAWLLLAAVVLVTVRWRRRVVPVWILIVGYVLAVQLPIVLIRGGPNTAAELMQSLRYLADVAVVLAAATALLLAAPPRTTGRDAEAIGSEGPSGLGPTGIESSGDHHNSMDTDPRHPDTPRGGKTRSPGRMSVSRAVAMTLTAAFVAGSVYTTVSFTRSWEISPTRTYLTNARAAFADWDGVPLLEQEVPWGVLTPMTYPQNLIAQVLGPIAPPGAFGTSTPHLRMFTDEGKLVDASVWWNRRILAGPEPGCGYRIDGSSPVALWLDGPMIEHGWTAQINYFADRDGRLTVAMEHGDAVVAPVRAGVHTVFVHLVGRGEVLRIGSRTPGLDVCVGVGPVGVAAFGQ